MRCGDYRELLSALVDDELMADEVVDVRAHLAGCADCAREYDALGEISRRLKEGLVRHSAPDVLKARIRSALAQPDAFSPATEPRTTGRLRWTTLAAAGLVIAAASSALTFGALHRAGPTGTVTEALLDSHIRSLMPGHLTDVVSTNQHLVKPWFNGRLDLSPAVPNLDSLGFPLIGGRLDYIEGRAVAVVVYGRRQHVINVYSWPVNGVAATRPAAADQRGYHLVEWRSGDVEYWAVSDVNRTELDQFVKLFSGVR